MAPWSGGVVLITPGRSQLWQHAVKADIGFAYPTCSQGSYRRNIAMPFGTEKLEWLGYPIVKKN